MQDLNFPAECLWQNILADARETRRNELQEQCSETGDCTWSKAFENFITHLKSVKHPQTTSCKKKRKCTIQKRARS
ncbi:unnamed protein product [Arabidopsis halleri]